MTDSANPPNVELRGQREINLSTRIDSDIAWIKGNLEAMQAAHRSLAAKVERLDTHYHLAPDGGNTTFPHYVAPTPPAAPEPDGGY